MRGQTMTLLKLFSPFKKIKSKWLADKEAKLTEKYATELLKVENSLRGKQNEMIQLDQAALLGLEAKRKQLALEQAEVEDLQTRMDERKKELASINHELREQIRIVEAKGRPDQIWVTAFTAGFSKAWDMMAPLMTDGVVKMRKTIHDQAIDETLRNLESTIAKRIELAKKTNLKPMNEILAKKSKLENRLQLSTDNDEKATIVNYLEALDWALNGKNLQKNQS